VKKGGSFLLKKDFGGTESKPLASIGPETEFHKTLRSGERLTFDADEKKRAKQIAADPKLQAAAEGAEFVPVKAEDLGVEALDDYTLRITLKQSAPYFLGLLGHSFFRLVPQHVIEKSGKQWTRKENIVTNGAFKIKEIRPYDALIVERNPNYWDAGNVHLDGIQFYPVEDLSTGMNLYKGGSIDAFLNHFVPSSWVETVREYKDEYLNYPEASTAYYSMNTTKPPFDNIKVRKAFVLAVDQTALSNFRKVTKPLTMITPTGIFPDYDKAREKVKAETPNAFAGFDAEAARKALTEAGFPVQKNGNTYSCPTFPADTVSLSYNTGESNRQIAEFIQAQWRTNLGVTVQLKNMEFKTFLPLRHELQYVGLAQTLWSGDYMDPNTFLGLFYGKDNNGDTGLVDPKYDKMIDEANAELDPQKRYEILARAEYYMLDQAVVVPLTINATNWMKKPYVKGMYPNPTTLHPWKFVYIEQDANKWHTNVADGIMAARDEQVEKQLADLVATQTSATGGN
jgi:oligopeptide transport system substrate-binding protein